MDYKQLRSFLKIVEGQNFTEASALLGISQSGISRRIQRLERELGVVLFERHRVAFRLTSEGKTFKEFAEDSIFRYDQLFKITRVKESDIQGPLRIAASTTPGEFIVPDLVAKFAALYPKIEPEVATSDSAQVFSEVQEQRWEIGFVGMRPVGNEERGLQLDTIGQDEVVLVTPLDHAFAIRGEIDIRELHGQRFLQREGGSGTLRSVMDILQSQGIFLPSYQITMGVNSTEAILSGVERGHGIGWVSSLSLRGAWTNRVSTVRLRGVPLFRSLFLVRIRTRPLSHVAKTFCDFVLNDLVPQARLLG